MKAKIFIIAFDAARQAFDDKGFELFCSAHEVKRIESAFFHHGEKPWWTVCVHYAHKQAEGESSSSPKPPSIELTGEQRLIYEALRQYRREASEEAGIPAYLVATNRQLSIMVAEKCRSLSALEAIKGFGKKRVEKHGKAIVKILRDFYGNDPKD